jgi:hypothetical protein
LDSWCAVDPLPSTSTPILNVLHLDFDLCVLCFEFHIYFMFMFAEFASNRNHDRIFTRTLL